MTRTGLDLSELDESEKERKQPTQVLRVGDVVGRTLGDEPNWCIVQPEADGYRVIRNQVHVLAPSGIPAELLVTFLSSEMARVQLSRMEVGATVPRVSAKSLRELLVPDMAGLTGLDPVGALRELRAASTALLDDLTEQVGRSFDLGRLDLRQSLVEAEQDAELAAAMIRQVRDNEYRSQQTFPHPLARAIRQLRMKRETGDGRGTYDELLRVGETATIFLGMVMGSLLRERQVDCPELDAWREGATSRGAALGHWTGLVRQGAEAARREGNPLGGLATALRTNGPLLDGLNVLLQRRNDDSHGSAPRTPFEYQSRVDELKPTLNRFLTDLAALSHAQFFIIDSLHYTQVAGFTMSGRDLCGDHPDFMPWSRVAGQPLETGVIYVDFADDVPPLALHGYCSLLACRQCLREELYYPDRVAGDTVKMRSLERGHSTDALDSELVSLLLGH